MSQPALYFHHPSSFEHDPQSYIPRHPDTPERIQAIEDALRQRDWLGFERRLAPAASESELELVHGPGLIAFIRELSLAGGGAIDPDTVVAEGSYKAACHAVGGACAMTRALVAGEARLGFCGMRPAGHHAEPHRAMGFCLFNSVAIAAAMAIQELGLSRVFVLDWDVHHGNGTAEAFRSRADVLFASIHQGGIYPGTGPLTDVGSGEGEGYTINLPVPARSGEQLWLSLLEHVILPAARSFQPQLVLISAGFDAHHSDPLARCELESDSFAQMACQVRDFAASTSAPVGAVLEGGYQPQAAADCLCKTLAALDGEGEAISAPPEQLLTPRAAAQIGRYWAL